MSLDDLEARGELEPLASTADELARLHRTIRRRLRDANVEQASNEARFEHSCHAILGAALIGLRARDYRVDTRSGKHIMLINTLKDTAGLPDEEVRFLQAIRNHRNADLYEGGIPVSDKELQEVVSTAKAIVESVIADILKLRPEFDTKD